MAKRKYATPEEAYQARLKRNREWWRKKHGGKRPPGRPRKYATEEESQEAKKAYTKIWNKKKYDEDPEYRKKRIEYAKEWKKRNEKRVKLLSKLYRENNKEKLAAYKREHFLANKKKYYAAAKRYRNRIKRYGVDQIRNLDLETIERIEDKDRWEEVRKAKAIEKQRKIMEDRLNESPAWVRKMLEKQKREKQT